MEEFEKIQKIGEGAYGKVYMARSKKDGQSYALKKRSSDDSGVPVDVIREASILQNLNGHPNIIKLHKIFYDTSESNKTFIYFVLDLEATDLSRSNLDPRYVKGYIPQLLDAIHHCHASQIMHRDIGPKNILVSEDLQTCKLADFGLARVGRHVPYTAEVCSLYYRAPEILLGSKYTYPSDIWSLGCVFVYLWKHDHLFAGDSEIDQLMRIFSVTGTPTQHTCKNLPVNIPKISRDTRALDCVPRKFRPIVDGMLVVEPTKRLTSTEALRLLN